MQTLRDKHKLEVFENRGLRRIPSKLKVSQFLLVTRHIIHKERVGNVTWKPRSEETTYLCDLGVNELLIFIKKCEWNLFTW